MRCECKWDCPLPRFSKNLYDVGAGLQRGLKVYNKVTSDFACFNCILNAKNEHARIQSGWGGGGNHKFFRFLWTPMENFGWKSIGFFGITFGPQLRTKKRNGVKAFFSVSWAQSLPPTTCISAS